MDWDTWKNLSTVEKDRLRDTSFLDKRFDHYHKTQARIEVEFSWGEKKRGRVGITTGWKPCYILMLTTRSLGSSWILNEHVISIRQVS